MVPGFGLLFGLVLYLCYVFFFLIFIGCGFATCLVILPTLASLLRLIRAKARFEQALFSYDPVMAHQLRGRAFGSTLGWYLELERFVQQEDAIPSAVVWQPRAEFRTACQVFRWQIKQFFAFAGLTVGTGMAAIYILATKGKIF